MKEKGCKKSYLLVALLSLERRAGKEVHWKSDIVSVLGTGKKCHYTGCH